MVQKGGVVVIAQPPTGVERTVATAQPEGVTVRVVLRELEQVQERERGGSLQVRKQTKVAWREGRALGGQMGSVEGMITRVVGIRGEGGR